MSTQQSSQKNKKRPSISWLVNVPTSILEAWWNHACSTDVLSLDNITCDATSMELCVGDTEISHTLFDIAAPSTVPPYVNGATYQAVVREWIRLLFLQQRKQKQRKQSNKARRDGVASKIQRLGRTPVAQIRLYISVNNMDDWDGLAWTVGQIRKINAFYTQLVAQVMATATNNTHVNHMLIGGNCSSTQNRFPTFLVVFLATVYNVSRPFALLALQWCWANAFDAPTEMGFFEWWTKNCDTPRSRATFCSNIWCRAIVRLDVLSDKDDEDFIDKNELERIIQTAPVFIPEFDNQKNKFDSSVKTVWGSAPLQKFGIATTKLGRLLNRYSLRNNPTTNNVLRKKIMGVYAKPGKSGKSPAWGTQAMRDQDGRDQKKAGEKKRKVRQAVVWVDLIGKGHKKYRQGKNASNLFDVCDVDCPTIVEKNLK